MACLVTTSKQTSRYQSHLNSSTKFQSTRSSAKAMVAGVPLFGAEPRAESQGRFSSSSAVTLQIRDVVQSSQGGHAVSPPNSAGPVAFFLSMAQATKDRLSPLYAEAVFASAGHFGILTEQPEWELFFASISGNGTGPVRCLVETSCRAITWTLFSSPYSYRSSLTSRRALVGACNLTRRRTLLADRCCGAVRCSAAFLSHLVPDCRLVGVV
jgi:hypothetical protein